VSLEEKSGKKIRVIIDVWGREVLNEAKTGEKKIG